jgi:hypothetical protein
VRARAKTRYNAVTMTDHSIKGYWESYRKTASHFLERKKMKLCPTCNQKIKETLESYSSGSGCLSLTWRYNIKNSPSSTRTVTHKDAIRHLVKEYHLANRNWLPVFVNDRWALARHVKRLGPNRLGISGHSYTYEIDTTHFKDFKFKDVNEVNLKTWFTMRVGGKTKQFELFNLSTRMAIRFFLNHEKQLKPQFKGHKVIKNND